MSSKVKVNCVHCNKEMERYPSQCLNTIYCSKECRKQYLLKHNNEKLICSNCGKSYYKRKGNLVNIKKNTYCSLKCKNEHQRELLRGSNNPYYGKKHSDETKQSISISKINQDLRGEKSPNYNKITVNCEMCGNEVLFIPYRIKRNNNYFCSTKCHDKWRSIYIVGENNPRWNFDKTKEEREVERKTPEYYEFIRMVYKRDNYTCQCCGNKGGDINTHHLNSYDWYKEGRTDANNGITLCLQCHKDFHMKYGYGNNTKEQFIEFIESR